MDKKEALARRIIVALDVDHRDEALSLIRQLEAVEIFKVGLELFTAEGPALLKEMRGMGKEAFLDLKLHDIPNTVAKAVRAATRHGVRMLTIHASGGREMMARAAQAASSEAEKKQTARPLLLAVTVLTSLKSDELQEIGMRPDAGQQVLQLASLARTAGADGVVCSPQEIEMVKSEQGRDFLVVAPGIRPAWASAQDQKRIMTPSEAIRKGADYIVIGRPIIRAPSPREAFLRILEEISESDQALDGKERP